MKLYMGRGNQTLEGLRPIIEERLKTLTLNLKGYTNKEVNMNKQFSFTSECGSCIHREICTLTLDYQNTVAEIFKIQPESYVTVTVTCKYFITDTRPRTIGVKYEDS